jgi:enterochelin esterase family protein
MMLAEIIPLVERSYRASPNRASRAIAGLSMGGSESLYVGLNHLDRFAAVGAFSAGVREGFEQRLPHLSSVANDQLKTLWIACGTSDRLFADNQRFMQWLMSQHIKFTNIETPGDHNWMVWRRNLAAFVPPAIQVRRVREDRYLPLSIPSGAPQAWPRSR